MILMTPRKMRVLSTIYIVLAPVAIYLYDRDGAWMMLFTAVMFAILAVMLRIVARQM